MIPGLGRTGFGRYNLPRSMNYTIVINVTIPLIIPYYIYITIDYDPQFLNDPQFRHGGYGGFPGPRRTPPSYV